MAPEEFADKSFAALLDSRTREELAQCSRFNTYPARTVLFHQGDPTRHVLIVLRGWVKVTSVSRGGDEALLAIRGPGDILGEVAAVDGQPRSATVTSLTAVEAQMIDGSTFVTALGHLPGLAMALLRHVTRSLRESDSKRLQYVSSTSSGRLAALLLELADLYGIHNDQGWEMTLPLSQRELASAAATSREAVARVLRTLRERDVIRTSRLRIEIVQPEVLRSLCKTMSHDA